MSCSVSFQSYGQQLHFSPPQLTFPDSERLVYTPHAGYKGTDHMIQHRSELKLGNSLVSSFPPVAFAGCGETCILQSSTRPPQVSSHWSLQSQLSLQNYLNVHLYINLRRRRGYILRVNTKKLVATEGSQESSDSTICNVPLALEAPPTWQLTANQDATHR